MDSFSSSAFFALQTTLIYLGIIHLVRAETVMKN